MATEAREAEAKAKIQATTTETAFKEAVWKYQNTNYVNQELSIKTPNKYQNQTYGRNRSGQIISTPSGSVLNRAKAQDKFLFMGGSSSDWQAKIKAEDANRALSQRQSASLRASGNAQIDAAQAAELNRLDGGKLTSATLGGDARIQNNVAGGTAAKAQDFGKGYTESTKAYGYQTTGAGEQARIAEIKANEHQEQLKELGLTHDVKELNALGLSTLYQQPIQSDAFIQKQQQAKPNYLYSVALNEGRLPTPQNNLSYIGYGQDGTPIQGPVKGEPVLTPFGNLGFIYQGKESIFNKPIERDFGKMDYAFLVDKGLAKRESFTDHLAYYAAIGERPITNTLTYLGVGGEKMKQYITPTTSQQVLLNIDEAYNDKKELGKGLGETWGLIKKDPLKTLVEIPGEAGMWIGAGKVLGLGTSLVVKGGKAISQSPSYLSKTLKPESLGSTVMVKKSLGELLKPKTSIEKSRQAKLEAAQQHWKSITPTQQNIKSIGIQKNRNKLRYSVLEKYKNPDYYKKFNRTTRPSFTSTGASMGISLASFVAKAKYTEPKLPPRNDFSGYKEVKTSSGTLLAKVKTTPQKPVTKTVTATKTITKTLTTTKPIRKTISTKSDIIHKTPKRNLKHTNRGSTVQEYYPINILSQTQSQNISQKYGQKFKSALVQSPMVKSKTAQKIKQLEKTSLIPIQSFKQGQKQTPKITPKLVPALKQVPKLVPKITPPLRPVPVKKTPPPVRPVRRPPGIVAWIPTNGKRWTKKPQTRSRARVDFIGNTRVSEVTGFRTKKSSIEYGKKTQKIYDDDLNWSRKKYKKNLGKLRL